MFSLFIRDVYNVERRDEAKNSFILVIPCCCNILVSSKEAACDAKHRRSGGGGCGQNTQFTPKHPPDVRSGDWVDDLNFIFDCLNPPPPGPQN